MSETPARPQPAPPAPEAPPSGLPHTPLSGAGAWLTFLVLYIPIPVLTTIPWVILAVLSHRRARPHGGPGAENARNALNWCLTYAAVVVGLLVVGMVSGFVGQAVSGVESLPMSSPFMWPFVLWFITYLVFGLLVLINGIRGAVGASKGRVVVAFPTIPFVKQPGVR